MNGNWRLDAVCAEIDPELWFPDKGDPGAAQKAKALCQDCPVKARCLEEALERNFHHGIWGGTTAKEREQMRRDRKKAAA